MATQVFPKRAATEIFCCMGTRPEIIKLAPLVHALRTYGVKILVVNSGQHGCYVTAPLYEFFGLGVDIDLTVQRDGEGLGESNARLLSAYTKLFAVRRPAVVVVQGDTSSAWQAAQAAFLLHIPVAHVEAGLRTYDLLRPFPEELNRTLIARLARWHFAPTRVAADALKQEAVPGDISVVGNTIVDAVLWGMNRLEREPFIDESAEEMALFRLPRAILVTAHRRENWGKGIMGVARAVKESLMDCGDLTCVWVLHPNPAISEAVRKVFKEMPDAAMRRLQLIPPQSYGQMLWMMHRAWLLLTDSGGIQEEAVTLGLPVFVTRNETERPEVIECGVGRLVGTNAEEIRCAVGELLRDARMHARMTTARENPYGDGQSARRIAEKIVGDLLSHGDAYEPERMGTRKF